MNNYKVILVRTYQEKDSYDVTASSKEEALNLALSGEIEIADAATNYEDEVIKKQVIYTGGCHLYTIRIFSNEFPSCYDDFLAWAYNKKELLPAIENQMEEMTNEYSDDSEYIHENECDYNNEDSSSFDWAYKITDGSAYIEIVERGYMEILYDGRLAEDAKSRDN